MITATVEPKKRGRPGKLENQLKNFKSFSKPIPTDPVEIQRELDELRKVYEEGRKQIDEAKAADPFWFFEPSDGKVTEQGYKLLEKYLKPEDMPTGRLDSQLDAICSMESIRGISGGNQSGKSTTGAIYSFIKATGQVPDSLKAMFHVERIPKKFPQRGRVVGVDFKQLHSIVIPTYQYWVPRQYLIKGSWTESYSAQHNILTLTNGSTIEFMTNQQDVESFQGPPRDWVVYDEEPREDIHKENMMRFVTADSLDFMFCWTPTKGLSWATELFSQEKDEQGNDIKLFKLCSVTNKKANISVLDKILSGIAEYNEIKMRLLGEFVSLSGLVYGRLFNEHVHVIPAFKLNKKDHFVVRGCDPHLVKPSAAVELAVDRNGIEYVIGSYLKDVDTDEFKKDLKERTKEYRLGWTIFDKSCDSNLTIMGYRNIWVEMTRGKNAVPAAFQSDKFTGSINAGVDEIKKLLKNNEKTGKPMLYIFDIPENKPLIHAMKFMERDTYVNENDKGMKDRIKEGKYDLHACLRYIHQRNVRWMPEDEKVPKIKKDRYI